MELEIHIPILGPGGKQDYFFTVTLQEHFLQADHARAAPIVIGSPVEARSPEGGETPSRIAEFFYGQIRRFICKSQTGGPNVVLFPAHMAPKFEGIRVVAPCIQGRVETGLADSKYSPRENRIKLHGFGIVDAVPTIWRARWWHDRRIVCS